MYKCTETVFIWRFSALGGRPSLYSAMVSRLPREYNQRDSIRICRIQLHHIFDLRLLHPFRNSGFALAKSAGRSACPDAGPRCAREGVVRSLGVPGGDRNPSHVNFLQIRGWGHRPWRTKTPPRRMMLE